MSFNSQDYAALSEDAYKDYAVGRRAPGQDEIVPINGHKYRILEHVDNRLNGYQGTIYQRVDTNEIVVAHRGTEQIARDAVLTDGGMVVARTNVQAPDAIALTQRALAYAKKEGQDLGQRPPEVTVTGHSSAAPWPRSPRTTSTSRARPSTPTARSASATAFRKAATP